MKKYLSLLILFLVFILAGCSAKDYAPKSGSYSKAESEGGVYDREPGGFYHSDAAPSDGESTDLIWDGGDIYEGDKATNETKPRAGQLTASATMDNVKYDFWKSLINTSQDGNSEFTAFDSNFAFKTKNRIALTFPKGTFAKVSLLNGDDVEFVGITDANGVCYVFSSEEKESYDIKITYFDKDYKLINMNDTVTGDKEYTIETLEMNSELIEIMFVIDATGSMGDEMTYLQAEITDVIKKVKQANNNVKILLSIMVYRDKGDEYVTRFSDFTEDVTSQIAFLEKQSANGGGDFEEAVDIALEEACSKQWTSGNSTKILVHVADAPAHDKDVAKWNTQVKRLAAMGVRILTVASSGINKQTEYFFRCQSILTNGVYVHLTNDSGIGGDHIDASTEDKEEVELLNDCLVRLINGFYTGDFGTPINWRQSQSTPLS